MSFRNNFIIGLGGAGGQSVAAFRCTGIVRKHALEAMTKQGSRTVAFEYLYVDSSGDQKGDNKQWEAFGKNCSLNAEDYISVKATPSTFHAAENDPRIIPWLGDINEILDQQKTNVQLKNAEGAEQMRRFGRVLFALKAKEINTAIKEKIDKLRSNTTEEGITFHIFATLGGGTGSGSLVDMVTTVNTICRQQNLTCKVFLYLFVGGESAREKSVGYFFQNEYAVLRDLNAIMVSRYNPHMAAYVSSSDSCDTFDGQNIVPVSQVYLCSDVAPVTFKGIKAQAKFMAEACFDTIYSHFIGLDADVQKAFSGEDIQTSHPSEDGVRSYKFATIGLKRWCVPTDRISEIMQLLFRHVVLKHWINGDTRHSKNRGAQMIFAPEAGSKYDPVLDLQNLIDNSEVTKHVNNPPTAQEGEVPNCYLKEKAELIGKKFDEVYVTGYDRKALDILNDYTKEVLRSISNDKDDESFISDTFGDYINRDVDTVVQKLHIALAEKRAWSGRTGVWGLNDLKKCINKFIDHISKLSEDKGAKIDFKDIGNMVDRAGEWKKFSVISTNLPKRQAMMLRHQEEAVGLVERAVESLYKTVMVSFYTKLIKELENMNEALDKVIKDLQTESDKVRDAYTKLKGDLIDIRNNKVTNDMFKYDFDEQNLDNIINFIDSEAAASYVADRMRTLETRCWDQVWARSENAVYYPTQPSLPSNPNLLNELKGNLASDRCAWDLSKELVQEITKKEAKYDDIFHGNLYERLMQSWQNMDETQRREEIVHFIKRLCTSAELDVTQPMAQGGVVAPRGALALGLPKTDVGGLKNFIREVIEKNVGAAVSPGRFSTYDIENGDEIRVLYCQYWMPARFAKVVQTTVYKEYLNAMQSPDIKKAHRTAYLCNMDNSGSNCDENAPDTTRPSLKKPDKGDEKFRNKIDLLCMLPLGTSKVAIMKPAKYQTESKFHVAKKVELKEGETPSYETYPMAMLSTPNNNIKSHVDEVTRDYIVGMDEPRREQFIDEYNRHISEVQATKDEGPLDPEVQAMQKHKEFCLALFESIRYIPKKK